jgi:hypothetical protein
MNWFWPRIHDEAAALRALHSAAMIPIFAGFYCALLGFHTGALTAGILLAAVLAGLARAIQLGSRVAVALTLGLGLGVVILQPHLFLGWLCLYLTAAYGLRGCWFYTRKRSEPGRRPDRPIREPFLALVAGWLWPEIADGPTAVRAIQRESLFFFWLGIEMACIHVESRHYTMAAFVLWATLALLFALSRGSRLAALFGFALLAALGPVFLPVFPLRPQHWLAVPLVISGVRGTLAYRYFRRLEGKRAFEDGSLLGAAPEPRVGQPSRSIRA